MFVSAASHASTILAHYVLVLAAFWKVCKSLLLLCVHQEKEMSSSGLSPEVLDTVKGIVRTAVLEHWVLDSQAKVKAEVISELQKNVMENTHATQQEVVERKVREAVTAAVNTNAPSKVHFFVPAHYSFLPTVFPISVSSFCGACNRGRAAAPPPLCAHWIGP